MWTDGKLHEKYPDQIRSKRSAGDDISRLEAHVYPVIGALPVSAITLEHCEAVMAGLPKGHSPDTRRHVGQALSRLLKMAVYPLRLIERSPLPEGFLPKPTQKKALGYLYPDEDRRLMACTSVPLEYRVLWGVLAREGMRESEALNAAIGDIDVKRGAIKLDKNKTDDPRAWALNTGVPRALKLFIEQKRSDADAADVLFVDENGKPISKFGLAALFREHLEQVGLRKERPELFDGSDSRIPIRVHDLRGTFITVSLANGKTESWICDRTGHRSSQMIANYKRVARQFTELNQGDFTPLDEAIPEFREQKQRAASGPCRRRTARVGQRVGQKKKRRAVSVEPPWGLEPQTYGLRNRCSTN